MNEFENKIAYSRCCNAKLRTYELQTVQLLITRSSELTDQIYWDQVNKEIEKITLQ